MSSMERLKILLPAILLSLLLTSSRVSSGGDMVSFKGWTEVDMNWPIEAPEYFIATSKGHHFISVKLPGRDKLTSNLVAHIEYYFTYSRVKPVFQVVPCKNNIDIIPIGNVNYGPGSGRWETHEIMIRHEDCRVRNELAYNVLLHDAGDVFAWRLVEVKSVGSRSSEPEGYTWPTEPATSHVPEIYEWPTESASTHLPESLVWAPDSVTTEQPKSEPVTTLLPFQSMDSHNEITTVRPTKHDEDTTPGQMATTESTYLSRHEQVTTFLPYVTGANHDSATKAFTYLNPDSATTPDSIRPEIPTRVPSPTRDIPMGYVAPWNRIIKPYRRPTNQSGRPIYVKPDVTTNLPQTVMPFLKKAKTTSPSETVLTNHLLDSISLSNSYKQQERRLNKRQADISELEEESNTSAPIEPTGASCRPRSCDRDHFKFARFSRVIKDLPRPPAGALETGKKFYLNMNGKPLEVQLQTDDDFGSVDTCLDMLLYMDPGTEVQLLLKGQRKSEQFGKTLEVLQRKPGDSAASKWDSFKRCLGDYMPRLESPNGGEIHSLDLKFVPKTTDAEKWIGIMVDPQRAVATKVLYPMYEYLPNVVTLSDERRVADYWLMDRDGIRKPELILRNDSRVQGGKVLHIQDIDQHQDSFDLTSRWLKINNLETTENPIFMMYRANRPDWIREILFEFQRAGSDWISQRVYLKSPPEPINMTSAVPQTDTGNETNIVPPRKEVEQPKQQHLLPIRMKGLDDKAFRLRVRHYLDRDAPSSSSSGNKELEISTLAFGDACAESSFCLNGGKCRPIGPSSARCTCLQGFSGRHCQTVRPCDVLYGNQNGVRQTGRELCQSIGAQCVETLPVLRCKWPNDQYYQCRALYQEQPGASEGESVVVPAPPAGSNGSGSPPVDANGVPLLPSPEEIVELKEQAQKQAKLIIVLSVFMAALMLFAVVLMASIVGRLVKSKRRLKEVQIEVVELTKRSQPGPSSARTYGRPAPQRPANLSNYNNQAFDVE